MLERDLGYTAHEIDPTGIFRNPFAFVCAVIRKLKARSPLFENAARRLDDSELLHEGCKALWHKLTVDGLDPDVDPVYQCTIAVSKAIRQFLVETRGRSENSQPDAQLSVFPDVFAATEAPAEASEQMQEIAEALLRLGGQVLRQGRKRPMDGEHDVIVLKLFASGLDAAAVATWCDWLKDTNVAEKALIRIVQMIRQAVPGADITAPIILTDQGRAKGDRLSGRKWDLKKYQADYYQQHREELAKRSRERMQAKRALEKALGG